MTLYEYSVCFSACAACLCIGVFIGLVRGIAWGRKQNAR